MSENTHHQSAREALAYLENAAGSHVDPDTQALMTAQVEATLSLAYEQRTSNLIAIIGWLSSRGITSKDIARQIDERLGFGQETS